MKVVKKMSEKANTAIEIEKKYIISMPCQSDLEAMDGYSNSEILQIYLPSDDGSTHRVRRRRCGDKVSYTETRKIRIDRMSATEIEGEISAERFAELAAVPKSGTTPINKTRHVFFYLGQQFEIDVYPEWKNTAIMETELETRDTEVKFPEFIKIIRDVTGERGYSNAAMSVSFPKESIV